MATVDALNMSPEEWKSFLDSFDHVFSDCDGVIWNPKILPGVGEFYKQMKKHGKTVNFVSNNSLRSKENYQELFEAAGIENGFENLIIPSIAIAEYLKSVNFNKTVYCVTCPETVKVLESHGFKCEYGPLNLKTEDYENYFLQFLEDNEEIGAVVFDSDLWVNLAKIYRARTYLTRPDVLFIAGASDKTVIYVPGRADMTSAIFIPMVEEQVGRKVMTIGKPAKVFGDLAMRRAGVTEYPSRVLFIGDMIEQDLGLGKASGFKTMLVLTNLSEETMRAHPVKPDYYTPSLGSLVSKF